MGIDLDKTKKSFIYKFKSPVTGKYRIITLDNFSCSQNLDENQIDNIVDDYYQLRRKIRNGLAPLAEKDAARQEHKLAVRKQEEEEKQKALAEILH